MSNLNYSIVHQRGQSSLLMYLACSINSLDVHGRNISAKQGGTQFNNCKFMIVSYA